MSKSITVTLSDDSIQATIQELEQYQIELETKIPLFTTRVAELLKERIEGKLAGAVADEYFDQTGTIQETANYSIGVENNGDTNVVWASGQDVIFLEFGTGVYYNGSAGSSPHPKGAELGFTIGSYGKGLGKRKTWGFYRDGHLYKTHGIRAEMPLYNSLQEICGEIEQIAKEVFGA